MSTLIQLLECKSPDGADKIACYIPNGPIQISDKPKFTYRGIMVDTARNFISMERLQEIVQTMAAVKLNVLHLHLVDTASWPVEIEAMPELA